MKLVEACEARGGLFRCQEGWRKQFSSLGRCCESRAWLRTSRHRESSFHHCGRLVEASLSARKDRESSFHHWRGAVKVVQSCLSARKDRERSFHHYGGAVNLVKACLSAGKV